MTSERPRSLVGPILGTIVFVILVPGSVIVWAPWAMTDWRIAPPLLGLEALRWLGVLLFLAGVPVFVDFLVRFVKDGLGTPAPLAEPVNLVVTGLFQYVRNPGYVGVVAMIVGQALFFGAALVMIYAGAVALVFHLFVVFWEEPHLRRKYRVAYVDYCERVPRWLPRLGLRSGSSRNAA